AVLIDRLRGIPVSRDLRIDDAAPRIGDGERRHAPVVPGLHGERAGILAAADDFHDHRGARSWLDAQLARQVVDRDLVAAQAVAVALLRRGIRRCHERREPEHGERSRGLPAGGRLLWPLHPLLRRTRNPAERGGSGRTPRGTETACGPKGLELVRPADLAGCYGPAGRKVARPPRIWAPIRGSRP